MRDIYEYAYKMTREQVGAAGRDKHALPLERGGSGRDLATDMSPARQFANTTWDGRRTGRHRRLHS